MSKYIMLNPDGKESEPLSGRDLVVLAKTGHISSTTLIRGESSRQWHRAGRVPVLAAALTPQAQPTESKRSTTEQHQVVPATTALNQANASAARRPPQQITTPAQPASPARPSSNITLRIARAVWTAIAERTAAGRAAWTAVGLTVTIAFLLLCGWRFSALPEEWRVLRIGHYNRFADISVKREMERNPEKFAHEIDSGTTLNQYGLTVPVAGWRFGLTHASAHPTFQWAMLSVAMVFAGVALSYRPKRVAQTDTTPAES